MDLGRGCRTSNKGTPDTRTLMIIAKVGGQCNISFFIKMCYWMVNIRFHRPEPHWTPYDVKKSISLYRSKRTDYRD